MMKSMFAKLVFFSLAMLAACGNAEEGNDATTGKQEVDAAVMGEQTRQSLQASLAKTFGELEITNIESTPIKGMVEVVINGGERVYASVDGKYLITGELFSVTDKGVASVTESKLAGVRAEGISTLDLDKTITFAAQSPRAEVFVFTDVSCGYCRKLHGDIAQLNEQGITVHYLAFPRAGVNSQNAQDMQAVWCAKDPAKAITEEKLAGGMSEKKQACDDPVEEQYKLGLSFGVRGTPAIYNNEGMQLGGYLPPGKLLKRLDLEPR